MKKKILIVDDDPSIRDIFSIIFEKAGYDTQLIGNGEDLLQSKFEIPDLFLIDKQLSGTNGLDICRELKNSPKTKDVPVIMISASPDIGQLSKSAGADDYIEKPFEVKSLLNLVAHFLNKP